MDKFKPDSKLYKSFQCIIGVSAYEGWNLLLTKTCVIAFLEASLDLKRRASERSISIKALLCLETQSISAALLLLNVIPKHLNLTRIVPISGYLMKTMFRTILVPVPARKVIFTVVIWVQPNMSINHQFFNVMQIQILKERPEASSDVSRLNKHYLILETENKAFFKLCFNCFQTAKSCLALLWCESFSRNLKSA